MRVSSVHTKDLKGYLDRFVPTASSQNAHLRGLDPFDNLDRRVMLGNLRRLTSCDVKHATGIVSTAREYLCTILTVVLRLTQDLRKRKHTLFQQIDKTGPW